jgi:hypothetical protein
MATATTVTVAGSLQTLYRLPADPLKDRADRPARALQGTVFPVEA